MLYHIVIKAARLDKDQARLSALFEGVLGMKRALPFCSFLPVERLKEQKGRATLLDAAPSYHDGVRHICSIVRRLAPGPIYLRP